eukprot:632822-Rhodomonas_salina.1
MRLRTSYALSGTVLRVATPRGPHSYVLISAPAVTETFRRSPGDFGCGSKTFQNISTLFLAHVRRSQINDPHLLLRRGLLLRLLADHVPERKKERKKEREKERTRERKNERKKERKKETEKEENKQ